MIPFFKRMQESRRPRCAALVPAAGSSSRMGGVDKQLMELDGVPVLVRTLLALEQARRVDTIVVATRNHTSLDQLNREIACLTRKYQGQFIRLDTLNIDISSEILRSWIADQKSIRYYVPDPVISFIEEQQIYQMGSEKL